MTAKVLEAPDRIFLNVGDLSDIDDPALFKNLNEVTWCQHIIDEHDIEYVRADIASSTSIADTAGAKPVAWAVYWGLGQMRQNSVHFERETAAKVASEIKSHTEIRPLYAAPPAPSVAEKVFPDDTKVICPACTHQFRAIPLDVQRELASAPSVADASLSAENRPAQDDVRVADFNDLLNDAFGANTSSERIAARKALVDAYRNAIASQSAPSVADAAGASEPFGWVQPKGGNYFTRSETTAKRIGGLVPVYLGAKESGK